MADDLTPTSELEIAHVLFIDVVGYSKLLTNEQTSVVAELNRLTRTYLKDAFRIVATVQKAVAADLERLPR